MNKARYKELSNILFSKRFCVKPSSICLIIRHSNTNVRLARPLAVTTDHFCAFGIPTYPEAHLSL